MKIKGKKLRAGKYDLLYPATTKYRVDLTEAEIKMLFKLQKKLLINFVVVEGKEMEEKE